MKVKYENDKYWALAEYKEPAVWYPFWDQQDAKSLFRIIHPGEIIEMLSSSKVYFSNCGQGYTVNGKHGSYQLPCSAAWPNSNCLHCGGLGLGATISNWNAEETENNFEVKI